jgi:hypothetical protein
MKVVLYKRSSAEISAIVAELKNMGYRVGKDFDFVFATKRYDWNLSLFVDAQTTFIFFNDKLATWFRLRYK